MRDYKIRSQEELDDASGRAGCFKGAVFSSLVVLSFYLQGFITFTASLFTVIGIIGIAVVGAFFISARQPTSPPMPPDVDEAARTHFSPSAPPAVTEDRIKQPDVPPGPDRPGGDRP